jgi:SAM-dependent methyltransferase
MKSTDKQHPQEKKYGSFWDRMAAKYPLPFDEKTLKTTTMVLSLAESEGVVFDGSDILDIGCGTGIYTLPLALQCNSITGIDTSKVMIDRMHEVAKLHNIENLKDVTGSWNEVDIGREGFEKAFDVVLVAMSPALRSLQDFRRMEKCSKKWCVYVGWGKKRENALMEELFLAHGLTYGPPPGVQRSHQILTESGRAPSLHFFENRWDWSGTTEEALQYVTGFIQLHGGQPDHSLIEEKLAEHENDGLIHHTTYVEQGLMVWPVP